MSEEKTAEQARIEELEAENAELREKTAAAEKAEADKRSPLRKMADAYSKPEADA